MFTPINKKKREAKTPFVAFGGGGHRTGNPLSGSVSCYVSEIGHLLETCRLLPFYGPVAFGNPDDFFNRRFTVDDF